MSKTWRLMAVDLGASGGKCFTGGVGRRRVSMREVHPGLPMNAWLSPSRTAPGRWRNAWFGMTP